MQDGGLVLGDHGDQADMSIMRWYYRPFLSGTYDYGDGKYGETDYNQ